jgi:sialidase-1
VAEEAEPHQVARRRWTPLGGALRNGAAAAAWGDAGETEVFALHEDGQLWDRYWDGTSWHAWESLGGAFVGQPAAAARDADRIDVFAIGGDGVLRHRWWDGKRWVEWRDVEGAPRGCKAVSCVWSGARLDVFVWGPDGGLHYADLG